MAVTKNLFSIFAIVFLLMAFQQSPAQDMQKAKSSNTKAVEVVNRFFNEVAGNQHNAALLEELHGADDTTRRCAAAAGEVKRELSRNFKEIRR